MTTYMRVAEFCKKSGLKETYVIRCIKAVDGLGHKMTNKANSPYIVNTEAFMKAFDSGKLERYVC